MPDNKIDKKELATNRLLEVLRGEVEEVESISSGEVIESPPVVVEVEKPAPKEDDAPVRLGLSEKEQKALTETLPIDKDAASDKGVDAFAQSINAAGAAAQDFLTRMLKIVIPQDIVIGIELSNSAIKYVYFIKRKNQFVLKDYKETRIDADVVDNPIAHIQEIRSELDKMIPENIRKDAQYATIISGKEVSIKKISLPKMAKKELEEAIAWNARKDLPFEAEDIFQDHVVLGDVTEKGVDKTEVLVSVVDNALLQKHLDLYKMLDIEPAKVLAVPLAIFNNFLHFVGSVTEENDVIIDIGSKESNILFIQGGKLQFVREISTGGNDIRDAITGTISTASGVVKINRAEAESLKLKYGIPQSGTTEVDEQYGISLNQLASMMRPSLERLATQIRRSIDYYRTKFPYGEPDKIYISGGTAQLLNFSEFINSELGKEVEILDPKKNIIVDPELAGRSDLSDFNTVYARIMGTVYSDPKAINLLPDDLKLKPFLKKQMRLLAVAAVISVIVMASMSFFSILASNEVNDNLREIDGQYQRLQQNNNTNVLRQQITRLNTENQSFMANIATYAGNLTLSDYLKLLSTLTPQYIKLNSVELSTIGKRELIIVGSVSVSVQQNQMSLALFVNKLKDSGMFINVPPYEIMAPEQDATGQVGAVTNFTLKCEM